MNLKARQIAISAIILAICIASQIFKNTSVYITGPIVNVCLIMITLTAGIFSGVILSVITPVTSFLITGSPIIAAIPLIMPMIMIGNVILVLSVGFLEKYFKNKIIIPMIIGSVIKSLFMGITIGLLIIPAFLPEKMTKMKTVFQITFSLTQLITALIGSVLATILWITIKKIRIDRMKG